MLLLHYRVSQFKLFLYLCWYIWRGFYSSRIPNNFFKMTFVLIIIPCISLFTLPFYSLPPLNTSWYIIHLYTTVFYLLSQENSSHVHQLIPWSLWILKMKHVYIYTHVNFKYILNVQPWPSFIPQHSNLTRENSTIQQWLSLSCTQECHDAESIRASHVQNSRIFSLCTWIISFDRVTFTFIHLSYIRILFFSIVCSL